MSRDVKVGDYKKITFFKNMPKRGYDQRRTGRFGEHQIMLEQILANEKIPFKLIYDDIFQSIYLLEDKVFVFLGLATLNYDAKQYDYSFTQFNADGSFPKELMKLENVNKTDVLICELNYNPRKIITPSSFHKLNRERIKMKLPFVDLGIIVHNYPFYSYGNQLHDACVNFCAELLKGKYDIKKILGDFEGVPCALILYKIVKDTRVGYAAMWTDKVGREHEFAQAAYSNYIPFCLDFKLKYPYSGKPLFFKTSDEFVSIYKEWCYEEGKELQDKKDINQHITYWTKRMYDDTFKIDGNRGQNYVLVDRIIDEARRGLYAEKSFYEYMDGRKKWKSEYLVYQIVKKMYPLDTIYQYGAPFLKNGRSQLVYDVFVASLNLAIEYQGEQHFKNLEFFGNQKDFRARKKRDALKKKLSEENGVKLIYINYNEDICEELIEKKIANAMKI